MMTAGDVRSRLQALARIPVLLVGCDYDGTLAPIVENPDLAHPNVESVAALRHLALLPGPLRALAPRSPDGSSAAALDLAAASRAGHTGARLHLRR